MSCKAEFKAPPEKAVHGYRGGPPPLAIHRMYRKSVGREAHASDGSGPQHHIQVVAVLSHRPRPRQGTHVRMGLHARYWLVELLPAETRWPEVECNQTCVDDLALQPRHPDTEIAPLTLTRFLLLTWLLSFPSLLLFGHWSSASSLWSLVFGLRPSVFGLRSLVLVLGLRSSAVGLRSLVFSLWSLVFGLRSLVVRLRPMVFGLSSLAVGLRYLVIGLCGLVHASICATFFCWIPFGDHPLKLERYRED